MTQFSRKKIIAQKSSADLTSTNSRITNLENNEYKVTYFEIVSGTSGSLTVPSQATINSGEFGLSGNAVLSKIDGSNKPTFESPKTSGGIIVTASLNVSTGAWTTSGTYTDSNVALIYSIKIKAINYGNLTYGNIIETIADGSAYIKNLTSDAQTQLNGKLSKSRSLIFTHQQTNPADAISSFFGGNIISGTVSGATGLIRRAYAPCTGFIYASLIELYITSILGTSETATVKVNNLTAATSVTLTTTLNYTAVASGTSIELGTPLAVTAGDALEIEVNYPTWATNPTGVIHIVTLEIGAK